MVRVQRVGYPTSPRFSRFSNCAWDFFWGCQGKWSIDEVLVRSSIIWNSIFECGIISKHLGVISFAGIREVFTWSLGVVRSFGFG